MDDLIFRCYDDFVEFIQKNLKKSSVARKLDCGVFKDWEEGSVTTEECIEEFKKNNRIDMPIPSGLFSLWLLNLGYIRDETQ